MSDTRELARLAAEAVAGGDEAASYVVVVQVPGESPNTSLAHNLADDAEARRFVAEVAMGSVLEDEFQSLRAFPPPHRPGVSHAEAKREANAKIIAEIGTLLGGDPSLFRAGWDKLGRRSEGRRPGGELAHLPPDNSTRPSE